MIFLCFLFHPLSSFATFSSAYLFFYIPEDSSLMRISLLPLFLCVMCVQSNSIFFFFIWFSVDFCLVILRSSSFVILSVRFIFIIRLKHLFINICILLVIWLAVFQVSQAYNNNDFIFVLKIFMYSSRYFCQILMKLEFSGQIFEKYSNIKFRENPSSRSPVLLDFNETWIFSTDFRKNSNIKFRENLSSGSPVVPCGRTQITKLMVCFSKFWECA